MTELNDERLKMLDEFAFKFMEVKKYLLGLNLVAGAEHVRIAIQYFDDGFMRAREAIFSLDTIQVPESPSNDSEQPAENPPLAAVN